MQHTAAELKTNNDFLFLGDWNTRPSTGTPVRGYATDHMISSFSQLCVYIPATADSCRGRGEGFKLFSTQSVSVEEQLLWQYSEHHLADVLLNMLSKNLPLTTVEMTREKEKGVKIGSSKLTFGFLISSLYGFGRNPHR